MKSFAGGLALRALLAALLAGGVACGSDGSPPSATPTASPTATETASPSASATATPTPTPPSTSTATPPATPTATPDTLRAFAAAAGVHIGASFVEGSQEEQFRSVLVREFNSTTAPVYWSSTEPQPGVYDFTTPDLVLDIAAANGLRVRGHPLVWGRLALPDYVNQAESADQLRAMMSAHIRAIVGRYRGRIAQYDVVNEPLTLFGTPGATGTPLDDYVFLRLLGPGYVREALDLAHAADPDAKLFVNELLVLRPGPKQDAFYELVRGLLEAGAPLDGVGFQGHVGYLFPDYIPSREEVAATVRRFRDLGLEVEITELDVTLSDPATQTELQGQIYRDVAAGCFFTPGCGGMTTWGITDKHTWIRNFFHLEGAPLMFDDSYRRKPAYFAVRDVLQQLAAGNEP